MKMQVAEVKKAKKARHSGFKQFVSEQAAGRGGLAASMGKIRKAWKAMSEETRRPFEERAANLRSAEKDGAR